MNHPRCCSRSRATWSSRTAPPASVLAAKTEAEYTYLQRELVRLEASGADATVAALAPAEHLHVVNRKFASDNGATAHHTATMASTGCSGEFHACDSTVDVCQKRCTSGWSVFQTTLVTPSAWKSSCALDACPQFMAYTLMVPVSSSAASCEPSALASSSLRWYRHKQIIKSRRAYFHQQRDMPAGDFGAADNAGLADSTGRT